MNTGNVFELFTESPSQQDSGGCETQAVAKITSKFIHFLFPKHLGVHSVLKGTVTAVVLHDCKCDMSQRQNIVGFLEKGSVHVLWTIHPTVRILAFDDSFYDALQFWTATSYSIVFLVMSRVGITIRNSAITLQIDRQIDTFYCPQRGNLCYVGACRTKIHLHTTT